MEFDAIGLGFDCMFIDWNLDFFLVEMMVSRSYWVLMCLGL